MCSPSLNREAPEMLTSTDTLCHHSSVPQTPRKENVASLSYSQETILSHKHTVHGGLTSRMHVLARETLEMVTSTDTLRHHSSVPRTLKIEDNIVSPWYSQGPYCLTSMGMDGMCLRIARSRSGSGREYTASYHLLTKNSQEKHSNAHDYYINIDMA
eukprot:c17784_g1_i1 orf=399-869(-)